MSFTLDDDEELPSPPPPPKPAILEESAQEQGVPAPPVTAASTDIAADAPASASADPPSPSQRTSSESTPMGETARNAYLTPVLIKSQGSLPALNAASLRDAIELIKDNSTDITTTEARLQDLLMRQTALLQAEKLLEQRAVLLLLRHHLGFHLGRPVAAVLVYRCCLAWQCLDVDVTPPSEVLEQLVEQLLQLTDEDALLVQSQHHADSHAGSGAEAARGDPENPAAHFAYWLAVLSTLLALAHHQLGMKGLPYLRQQQEAVQHQAATPSATVAITEGLTKIGDNLTSLKDRMAAAFTRGLKKVTGKEEETNTAASHLSPRASAAGTAPQSPQALDSSSSSMAGGGSNRSSGVSSSLPAAVSFRFAIDSLTLRTYGVLRDAFKKQLAPVLPACIQLGTLSNDDNDDGSDDDAREVEARSSTPADVAIEERVAVLRPWSELVALLNSMLELLIEQCLPRIIVKCVMKQVLCFVDKQLFNQLLLRPECCSSSNIRFVAEGLRKLDAWLMAAGNEEYLAALYNDLKHIRQATSFLMTANKSRMVLQDVVQLCPALNMQQMYRLCTTYFDDLGESAAAAAAEAAETAAVQGADATATAASPSGASSPIAVGGGAEEGGGAGEEGAAPPPAHSPHAEGAGAVAADARVAAGVGGGGADCDKGGSGDAMARHGSLSVEEKQGADSVDMVSGELLEAFATQGVSSNGGLIVTFLLDEESKQLIANPSGVGVSLQVLQLVHDKALYKGMPIPERLALQTVPSEVFAFLEKDLPLAIG